MARAQTQTSGNGKKATAKKKAVAAEAATEQQAETTETSSDGPLLDMNNAAVKKLIKAAKQRGFVTHDELNEVLPSGEVSSEQIEDIMAMLAEMGINLVESEEENEDTTDTAERVQSGLPMKVERASEPVDRTDDPVRMYLREMGSVELLSREGEIAIAKRIEAGREAMIHGLCESPLTFQAIIIWRDELNEGRILLRDIIDLEATYAGPDAKAPAAANNTEGEAAAEAKPEKKVEEEKPTPAPKARTGSDDVLSPEDLEPSSNEEEDDEDDEEEANISLAAMEAELKPQVLETFDRIAKTYKSLRKLQDQEVAEKTKLSPSQARRYKKLREELIEDVKSLSLNAARIEALVEQLYDINKRLISLEGRLMRLAETYKVPRAVFLEEYRGNELDPNWTRRVGRLAKHGWKDFICQGKDRPSSQSS